MDTPPDLLTNGSVAAAARAALTDHAWEALVGGAETETTAHRNRLALDCIALRPRVLVGVGDVDPSTTFLGHPLRVPVLLASIGDARDLTGHGVDDAIATASDFGSLAFVARPRDGSPGPTSAATVMELSAHDGEELLDHQIDTAERGACPAVCLNLMPHAQGRRERDPDDLPRMPLQTRDVWRVASQVAGRTRLPVIAKGVMNAEDAQRALDHGCVALYVSNYGGRALDHCQATIDVLAEVVGAADGRAEVIVDGGFMRATDIVKALAFGAQAVAIGRLQGLGLAACGATGLLRVLANLEEELRICLALLGVTTVGALNRGHLFLDAPPVQLPHDTSAFFRSPPLSASVSDQRTRSAEGAP